MRRFVYIAVGKKYVDLVLQSAAVLRRHTDVPILIYVARAEAPPGGYEVRQLPDPGPSLSGSQLAHWAKAKLAALCQDGGVFLDHDVFVVSPKIDGIFDVRPEQSLILAPTASTYLNWSIRHGLKDPDNGPTTVEVVKRDFGVAVDPAFRVLNSGVFRFSPEAAPLAEEWAANVLKTYGRPHWDPARDQVALLATLFRNKLENRPTLPEAYNWAPGSSGAGRGQPGLPIVYGRDGVFAEGGPELYALHFIWKGGSDRDRDAWAGLNRHFCDRWALPYGRPLSPP